MTNDELEKLVRELCNYAEGIRNYDKFEKAYVDKFKSLIETERKAAVEEALKTIEEQLNLQYLDDSKNHLGYGPDEYNKGIDVCFRVIDDCKAKLTAKEPDA